MQHKHSMSKSMAEMFLKSNFKEPFHLQKTSSLTKNQYNNFQKLRYWGIIEKEESKSGWWRITSQGRLFANNKIKIPKSVWTFNNKVVKTVGSIFIEECTGQWRKREDYIQDMKPAIKEPGLF